MRGSCSPINIPQNDYGDIYTCKRTEWSSIQSVIIRVNYSFSRDRKPSFWFYCYVQIFFLQETVRRECEERLELTESLSNARTQLLALQRGSGVSLSRNSLSTAKSSPSLPGTVGRGAEKALAANELVNGAGSQASNCAVGFDGGVGRRASSGSRDSGRLSRAGSVDDSRQRIAVAMGRPGSKSRLSGDFGS